MLLIFVFIYLLTLIWFLLISSHCSLRHTSFWLGTDLYFLSVLWGVILCFSLLVDFVRDFLFVVLYIHCNVFSGFRGTFPSIIFHLLYTSVTGSVSPSETTLNSLSVWNYLIGILFFKGFQIKVECAQNRNLVTTTACYWHRFYWFDDISELGWHQDVINLVAFSIA